MTRLGVRLGSKVTAGDVDVADALYTGLNQVPSFSFSLSPCLRVLLFLGILVGFIWSNAAKDLQRS